jgi:hypothetical protein
MTLDDTKRDSEYVRCAVCGRNYVPLDDAPLYHGDDCPSDDCPSNNEAPQQGTLFRYRAPNK